MTDAILRSQENVGNEPLSALSTHQVFRGSEKKVNKLVGEKCWEGDLLFDCSKESHSLPGVIIPRFPVLTSQIYRS